MSTGHKQNRVTPFSTLISTPARGSLYGNRGCLHDEKGLIRRQFQGIRWIICLLEFKGRRHQIMKPGHYTELFFLDEATALADGHRPCAECQRDRFNLFRETWAKANPNLTNSTRPLATEIDTNLHAERLSTNRYCNSIDGLPNGTFISDNETDAYVVWAQRLLLWTPGGYKTPAKQDIRFPARILTPVSILRVLHAGYPVTIHHTAAASKGHKTSTQFSGRQ